MEFDRTLVFGLGAGVVALAIVIGGMAYAGVVSSNNYWAAVNRCTDGAGMWIPTNGGGGVCVRR